ncbi:uncharacterized short-chain type dehydrogenase/reductase y4vI-like [Eublepharis macularius]|uniref:Uncharacterized short-chain type dehydrogenase/reductase y4vI-like n=1 Tax=Eublepharis macularius TaxID=481883 RepID=A0AA97K6Z4_EUBMA|nr:uncharacterized short-chain type dehydrogenase/reductase y4vI-like [Eublepharis macularius]
MATYLRYPGKVVIVTGGTKGIGLAIVKEFVRQGAKVVFCSRASGEERGQTIQRELQDSGSPGDAYFQVCDVRNETDIKRLILVTIERYGCLDCLVNNAGVGYFEKTEDVSAQDFLNIMQINVVSCLLASKYALPYLRETRGNIVNIASIVGILGVKNGVSYAASKGAVIAMTKSMAIDESKYGVRVNSISPNVIRTPLWKKVSDQSPNPEALNRKARDQQLMGRLGSPEEVALGVLYLAADGTFCTGFNLVLSGGADIGFGKKSEVDPQCDPSVSGSSQDSSRNNSPEKLRGTASMTTGLRYQSKVVIVTGGTGGIGSAMVREFARQGAKVVFCAPKSEVEKGQALQKEIQDSGCAGEGYFQVCDLRIDSDIQKLVCVTMECYGRLDCLVNNAADFLPPTKIDDVTIQDFRSLVELNVFGVFLGSKYALPYLRRTKGNIINMGSLYAELGLKKGLTYASTKAAVISMTKSMAISESQYGVRVNCISPSNILPGMWRRYANLAPNPEAVIQEGKDYQLMGRFGTPEEVALAAVYLAAEGTFCTGLNLVLSGGAELGFAKKSQVDAKPGPSSSGSSQGGGDFMVPAWAGEKS